MKMKSVMKRQVFNDYGRPLLQYKHVIRMRSEALTLNVPTQDVVLCSFLFEEIKDKREAAERATGHSCYNKSENRNLFCERPTTLNVIIHKHIVLFFAEVYKRNKTLWHMLVLENNQCQLDIQQYQLCRWLFSCNCITQTVIFLA